MLTKVSIFIATSLDGFIARKNGSIDWLDKATKAMPAHEDGGFSVFMKSIDVLVMGRNTFDQVLSFGQWPYGDAKVIILTHRPLSLPHHLMKTVSSSAKSPKELFDDLAQQGAKHIYIDGGLVIKSFLQANLVDEIIITLIPVIIGDGIPLFGKQNHDIELENLETKSLFGLVQLKYKVKKLLAI